MVRLLAIAALVASCDGDGCNGGPTGSATKFCQDSIARIGDASLGTPAEICKGCCKQEVEYQGRIENGLCVCR